MLIGDMACLFWLGFESSSYQDKVLECEYGLYRHAMSGIH
jgi:hypothetical protein